MWLWNVDAVYNVTQKFYNLNRFTELRNPLYGEGKDWQSYCLGTYLEPLSDFAHDSAWYVGLLPGIYQISCGLFNHVCTSTPLTYVCKDLYDPCSQHSHHPFDSVSRSWCLFQLPKQHSPINKSMEICICIQLSFPFLSFPWVFTLLSLLFYYQQPRKTLLKQELWSCGTDFLNLVVSDMLYHKVWPEMTESQTLEKAVQIHLVCVSVLRKTTKSMRFVLFHLTMASLSKHCWVTVVLKSNATVEKDTGRRLARQVLLLKEGTF